MGEFGCFLITSFIRYYPCILRIRYSVRSSLIKVCGGGGACTHMPILTTVEAGGGHWLGVLPYHTFCPTSLRQGLSLNLTFFVSARMTGQHTSGILLSATCLELPFGAEWACCLIHNRRQWLSLLQEVINCQSFSKEGRGLMSHTCIHDRLLTAQKIAICSFRIASMCFPLLLLQYSPSLQEDYLHKVNCALSANFSDMRQK